MTRCSGVASAASLAIATTTCVAGGGGSLMLLLHPRLVDMDKARDDGGAEPQGMALRPAHPEGSRRPQSNTFFA